MARSFWTAACLNCSLATCSLRDKPKSAGWSDVRVRNGPVESWPLVQQFGRLCPAIKRFARGGLLDQDHRHGPMSRPVTRRLQIGGLLNPGNASAGRLSNAYTQPSSKAAAADESGISEPSLLAVRKCF